MKTEKFFKNRGEDQLLRNRKAEKEDQLLFVRGTGTER